MRRQQRGQGYSSQHYKGSRQGYRQRPAYQQPPARDYRYSQNRYDPRYAYEEYEEDDGETMQKVFSAVTAPFRFVGFAAKSIAQFGRNKYNKKFNQQNMLEPFQGAEYADTKKQGDYVCLQKGI